jgi:hypothetical protein
MFWYNVTRGTLESVPAPVGDAQAIEMLSGHPNSGEFIEEYRRKRRLPSMLNASSRCLVPTPA